MLARCERYFFLWKYKLFPLEMNVFTFRAIFFLLKSDTSGPFSIMRFSPLLKLNLSFSIPLNNQQKIFFRQIVNTEGEGGKQLHRPKRMMTWSLSVEYFLATKLSTPSSEPHWPKISDQRVVAGETTRWDLLKALSKRLWEVGQNSFGQALIHSQVSHKLHLLLS